MHSKHNLLYLLIFIITLYGCGSDMNTSSNDTGSAAFSLKWETPSNTPLTNSPAIPSPLAGEGKGEGGLPEFSYAPIDCTAIGVSTVSANVYDSGGTYITSGGPWNCADHSGTITGISAGINRMIAVSGKDSSNRIIYNGQITGVTIDKDQTTNAGQITMTYVANDTTAPTDGSLSASAGNTQVSLIWSGFTDSNSGLGSYKLVYTTTTTPSSCSNGTQIFTGTSTSYTHTGLTNSTTYYYRVCATDNAGNTSSGATASGTPTSSGTTTVTDIDGNVYNTVTIGTQVWMKEDLKVTKYRNGDAIDTTTTVDISGETSPKYQWANDGDESNATTYGRLYTWYAVTDTRGVCPTGWHVPTDAEWTTLTDYLGGESVAGGKMKEAGTTHWSSPNTSADNSSGFTALPGGDRSSDTFNIMGVYIGPFFNMGSRGYWWSATGDGGGFGAWTRALIYDYSGAFRTSYAIYFGFSVRCVRD